MIKPKVIWKNVLFACGAIAILAVSVSCSGSQVAPKGIPEQAQGKLAIAPARPPTEAEFERWRAWLRRVPRPESACLVATYPESQWREIPCVKPPNYPGLPANGVRSDTVGNGTDWSAKVTGHQYFAAGSFSQVKVNGENQNGDQNKYSLQLNTQPFNSYECKAHGSKNAKCQEWQQFFYTTDGSNGAIYIQYWLLGFGPNCPGNWIKQPKTENCFINSQNAANPPAEPVTNLGSLELSGTAALGNQQDIVEFSAFHTLYTVTGDNWFPDLKSQWQESEFNIFGDLNGSRAFFDKPAMIVVRVEVGSGKNTEVPSCDGPGGGQTEETNNLFLTKTTGTWPKDPYPSIVFAEILPTPNPNPTPSCIALGRS